MHLTGLRIRGFKSFAEPVELRFFPGVAVIVGPNGSGKSNVADAMQWAMASQPPSQLRAHTGQDVLFAGSDARAASAICEVELVLSNADGRIALPHEEVSVMRRVRRDGEGEYLLNRVAVRRLDVLEALADAGMGRELHCVVSQGSVDAILLSRPEERRGLVEEAAGLGKYKRRRLRAQQKLARVRTDLERAADLEREIRQRLRPLELQATAAERAERLGREVAEGRLRLLGSESAAARQRRSALAADLAGAREAVAGLEGRLAEARLSREAAEGELAALAGDQERASARSWGLAGALERVAARREALAERLAAAARDADREQERATRLLAEAEARRALAAAAAENAAALAGEAARLEPATGDDGLDEAAARAAEALEIALGARRAAAEAEGGAARAAADVERLERRRQEIERGRGDGLQASEAARAALEMAQAALAAAVPEAERRGAEAAGCERSAHAARVAADAARELEREARASAAAAREHAAAARARAEALGAAVARADGVAPAVRRLAERGATLALTLVRPQPGLEAAAAAALARRAASAVTDDLAGALRLLDGDGLDGASVLVRRSAAPATPAPAEGRALAELVELAPEAPPGLLDGVWLVEGPEAFAGVRSGLAVTREGLCWDADRGIAARPGAAGEAALLEARAEHERAVAEAARAEAEAEATGVRAQRAAGDRTAREGEERTAADAQRAAREALVEAERAESAARAALERAAREAERAEARAGELAAELAELGDAAEAARREALELGAAVAAAAEAAGAAESGHAALEEARRALADAAAERRAELAAVRERAARARADADRAGSEGDEAERAATGAAERARRLTAIAALEGRALPALDACLAAGERSRGPAREAVERFEQRAAELSQTLRECGTREAAEGQALRELASRATALEVESAQLNERFAELRRRAHEIAEQHELAIVDAVEPLPADDTAALAARLERLERRRAELGAVNPLARQEYDEQKERAEDVADQRADLEASLRELDGLIRELSETIRERFDETFERVREGFEEVVGTLFPGGRGRLVLAEGEPDEAGEVQPEPGIEVEVQPAGKRITSLALLSGGERAMAALAFLFALLMARPSPFYVLDEVDAALDDANIERFLALVDRYRERAQFIVISHQKRTIEVADVLYGVSMANDGISKVLSRRVRERTPAPVGVV